MEEFMLFHVIDDWVEFELDTMRLSEADSLKKAEEIELGMYWLADNYKDDRLFVRSGLLVPSEVIRFALREGVLFRVSHAIYPSNQLPKDYFVRFEDQLLELYKRDDGKPDHDAAKIPMLTFIGTLGKHTQQSWMMHVSDSMPAVFDYLVTKEHRRLADLLVSGARHEILPVRHRAEKAQPRQQRAHQPTGEMAAQHEKLRGVQGSGLGGVDR
eukprot:jgi/Chrzof1/14281/Cz08g31330.t1